MFKSIEDMTIEEFANMKYKPRSLHPSGYTMLALLDNNESPFAQSEETENHQELQDRLTYIHVLYNLGLISIKITEEGKSRLKDHMNK
jgi:hypothetical protein